jgi:hypothetical protein
MHLTDVETALRATFDRSRSTDGRVPGSRIREALEELAGLAIDVAPYEIADDALSVEFVPIPEGEDLDGAPVSVGVLCNRQLGLTGGPDGDGGWVQVGFELQVPVSVDLRVTDPVEYRAQLDEPDGAELAALLRAFDAVDGGTDFAATPTDPDVFLVDDDELF